VLELYKGTGEVLGDQAVTGPRILTFDIETMPASVYSWGLFNQNHHIEQIIEPDRMISFAAKWNGEPRVIFRSEYHHTPLGMVADLFDLLDKADVVVTYNGDNFDLPWVQRMFHEQEIGFPLPSPYVSVDLYRVIKRNERHLSHKLAYITARYNLTGKFDHHGFMLWRECNGDFGSVIQRKAWNIMRRYNKQDVVTTDELFDEVRPYIKNIPAVALFGDAAPDRPMCPQCGSERMTRQGYKRTRTRRYPQYQCQDCGRWMADTRSDGGVSSA
jgi:DNA polymerase elongation subunit (family B)